MSSTCKNTNILYYSGCCTGITIFCKTLLPSILLFLPFTVKISHFLYIFLSSTAVSTYLPLIRDFKCKCVLCIFHNKNYHVPPPKKKCIKLQTKF